MTMSSDYFPITKRKAEKQEGGKKRKGRNRRRGKDLGQEQKWEKYKFSSEVSQGFMAS